MVGSYRRTMERPYRKYAAIGRTMERPYRKYAAIGRTMERPYRKYAATPPRNQSAGVCIHVLWIYICTKWICLCCKAMPGTMVDMIII
jgi:hypothetical protein